MRFNSFGQAGAGVDATISIDKERIGAGTGSSVGPWWIDASRLLYRAASNVLVTYDQRSEQVDLVDARGANDFAACDGVWAAFLSNPTMVYASDGFARDGASLAAVGPNGQIAYCPNYQVGVPIVVREADGNEWTLTTEPARCVQLLGGRRAIWLDASGRIRAVGLPDPAQVGTAASNPRVAEIDGAFYLQYWVQPDGPLVLHPWHETVGTVLRTTPDAFNADLVAVAGILRSGFSTTAGERPSDLLVVDTHLDELTEPLVPAEPADPIVRIGRDLWFGFFGGRPGEDARGWETTVDVRSLPGNAHVLIGAIQPVGNDSRWLTADDGIVLAQYVEGRPSDADPDHIDAAIARARVEHPEIHVFAYWPRKAWRSGPGGSWRVPIGARYVGVEWYRLAGESIEMFERACAEATRVASSSASVIGIPQCYTSNASQTTDLQSIPPVAARITRDHVRVIGLAVFNGTGRSTGLATHPVGHPEMLAPWREVFDGITGAPPIPVGPIPPDPPVPPDPTPTMFPIAKEIHMEPTTVCVRIGSTFLRVDPAEVGQHPTFTGFTPVHIDRKYDDAIGDVNCHFLATEVAPGKVHLTRDGQGWLGQDATEFGAGIEKLLYMKPSDPQGYETWNGWQLGQGGPEVVVVQYDRPEDHGMSAGLCLTLVKV